jgi:cell division protein FtsX
MALTVEGMFMGLVGSCVAFMLLWALYTMLAARWRPRR